MARNNLNCVGPPPNNNLKYKICVWKGSVARCTEEMLLLDNGNESIDSYMSP